MITVPSRLRPPAQRVCISCGDVLLADRWPQCERCEQLAKTPWYTQQLGWDEEPQPLIRGKTPGASPVYTRPEGAPQPPTLPAGASVPDGTDGA